MTVPQVVFNCNWQVQFPFCVLKRWIQHWTLQSTYIQCSTFRNSQAVNRIIRPIKKKLFIKQRAKDRAVIFLVPRPPVSLNLRGPGTKKSWLRRQDLIGCSPGLRFLLIQNWFPLWKYLRVDFRTAPLEHLNRSFTVLSSADWECGKPIVHYGGLNGVWLRTYAIVHHTSLIRGNHISEGVWMIYLFSRFLYLFSCLGFDRFLISSQR